MKISHILEQKRFRKVIVQQKTFQCVYMQIVSRNTLE